MKIVDLRSDTVTKPTRAMLETMLKAEVGDDVFGEDPTVKRLERMLAEMAGMESAIFAPSGTQSNLIAIMAHCQRGDEYIVGHKAHTYIWEGGGAAVLGSVQPQTVECSEDGTLPLDQVGAAIKPVDDHHPRTKLLCLENTISGTPLPLDYLIRARAFCRENKLQAHLDGARVFNAAVKQQVELTAITRQFDSVSICLSKGLGAPVGSVLCGSRDFIREARRWRKVLGGGMRQAGFMAAAGIYALEHHIDRLKNDHINAESLAKGLAKIDEIETKLSNVQTNMFFVRITNRASELSTYLKERGILWPLRPNLNGSTRLVTHLDITEGDVKRVVAEVKAFYAS